MEFALLFSYARCKLVISSKQQCVTSHIFYIRVVLLTTTTAILIVVQGLALKYILKQNTNTYLSLLNNIIRMLSSNIYCNIIEIGTYTKLVPV